MSTYNFIIPISGYVKLGINADDPSQAGEILMQHKLEILPKIPNLFLDLDFDNVEAWCSENDNVNEN